MKSASRVLVLKDDVFSKEIINEHLVYNLIFPETALSFEGISEVSGDVRIVLSQEFVPTVLHLC